MFLILSCGVGIACGVLGSLVRFQFSICSGLAVTLGFARVYGCSIASLIPLGAVVV
jgi:hypothetical protein